MPPPVRRSERIRQRQQAEAATTPSASIPPVARAISQPRETPSRTTNHRPAHPYLPLHNRISLRRIRPTNPDFNMWDSVPVETLRQMRSSNNARLERQLMPSIREMIDSLSSERMRVMQNRIQQQMQSAEAQNPEASLNGLAARRLRRELSDLMREPPENCSAEPRAENIFHWLATIKGPEGTPYEGGTFKLNITIPFDYPFNPPQVMFTNKVYHCNISPSGYICMDILNVSWSPALTIGKVLLSIVSLLSDANPNDPLEMNIAMLYKRDRNQHDQIARSWTRKFAKE